MSTGKSGSNWLDRLRSSKGFPAGNDLDLEQFLNLNLPNPNPSNSNLSDSTIGPKLKSTETPRENGESEWFGIMSNVLSELFYIGDSNDFPRIRGKKSPRKQANPKICVLNDTLKLTKEENCDVDAGLGVEDDEDENADFSGFSRTEVTVIDTSYECWKCEKLLFRKKNVWRIREKKSKLKNSGMKKRKANVLEDESGGGGGEKKRVMSSNDVHLQSDKMKEDCKETPDILSQDPKKRFPKKSKKCGSSVILIKSVPTSKKNGANVPKSSLKLTQRQ